MIHKILILITIGLIISCTSTEIRKADTTGNILFKNLIKDAQSVDYAKINGFFRIENVAEIPSVFLKFDSECDFKESSVAFRISAFKSPITDLFMKNKKILIINHTEQNYIWLDLEKVDISKFTGINFNPLDMGYFFLGKIPYSSNMEIMDFSFTKKNYILNITDNNSKYTVYLDSNKQIISVKVFNQYFDNLNLDSIRYKKNTSGKNIPSMLNFSQEDSPVKLSFVINSVNYKPSESKLIDLKILKKYKEIFKIEDMKIQLKNTN